MTAPSAAPSSSSGFYVSNELLHLELKHLTAAVDVMRTHVVGELQMLRAESVRRDLYDEQRARDRGEVEDMRKMLDKAEQRKWVMWLAVATAVIALGKDILASVML